MWKFLRQGIDELQKDGWEALDARNYTKAQRKGRALIRKRHSSGFEILALAQSAMGQMADAAATLQAGVAKVPSVAILWHLLGSTLSECGRYEEALCAYEKALACDAEDADAIAYNRGVVLEKMQRYDEVLALVEIHTGETEKIKLLFLGLKLGTLNKLGRHSEVLPAATQLELFENAGKTAEDPIEESGYYLLNGGYAPAPGIQQEIARAWVEVATAQSALKYDSAVTIETAFRAIRSDMYNEKAQSLIRDLRNRKSINTKTYTVLVNGILAGEPGEAATGFFTSFRVAAENPEEALNFIQEFEPSPVSMDSWELANDQTGAALLSKGIYDISECHTYPDSE